MFDQYEKKLKEELAAEFPDLTLRQLWIISKLAKRVRSRARQNVAFNNMMNRLFPDFSFTQVTKTNPRDGSKYPGLVITDKRTAGAEDMPSSISEDESDE